MNSYYKFVVLFFLTAIAYSNTASASSKDGRKLLDGCNEVVNIYNKNQEKKLWAGLTTSNSESLKAGYCMGVMTAYKSFGSIRTVRQGYECGRDTYYGYRNETCYKDVEVNDCDNETWFEMASIVARKWSAKSKNYSTSGLLAGICNG
jgi:hypothetical protein